MKLLKPNWVSHDGNPIFSVDLHPDGSRFATGGQGDGGSSGKVVVWNTSPVVSAKDEHDENVPKILCVMDNHLACVNCVRWSCNGRYLASGGDDRIIMIWQFAGYGGAVMFGSSDTQASSLNGERWRCTHTLKRHTGDILQVAWSPTDQWLASCSIDNTVVVWNAQKFPEVTTVLRGHTSLVKGVTWDPVGTYLASQSDDKSVKVWKTLNWKLETTVTKPFKECGATTHVLRLDWSPDGGYLVSAHAMNNSGPTAQIIEREGWRTNMDFVGHRKAITCTRFNGRMFRHHREKESKQPRLPYTCCAVGSRDRSLSVWLTSLRRPLVVINDLFEDSVMDISWSFSGHSLFCCSWDGSVAYLEFKPKEIGESLSREEMNELHKKTYGKSMSIVSQPLVIENPAMLAIQQKKTSKSPPGDDKKATIPDPVTPIKYPKKQVEVRTPTGRRRIIPIFVAAQEQLGGVPRPFGSASAFGCSTNLSSNLSKSPSKLNRSSSFDKTPNKKSDSEKLDRSMNSLPRPKFNDKISPGVPRKIQETETAVLMPASSSSPKHVQDIHDKLEEKDVLKEKNKQLVDQRKMFLDSRLSEKTKSSQHSVEKSKKINMLSVQKPIVDEHIGKSDKRSKEDNFPGIEQQASAKATVVPTSQSKKVAKSTGLTMKRKATDGSLPQHVSPKQAKRLRKEHVVEVPDIRKQPAVQHPPHNRLAQLKHLERLPVKKVKKSLSVQTLRNGSVVCYKLLNDTSAHASKQPQPTNSFVLHKISCVKGSATEWETVLSSPGIAINANNNVICIACTDKTLNIFSSRSGRQIMPVMCVQATAYDIKCNGWKVMVIFSNATVSVWNAQSQKCVLCEKSFIHLLPAANEIQPSRRKSHRESIADDVGSAVNEENIESNENSPIKECKLTDAGLPLLTFGNNHSYTYCQNMSSWVLINSAQSSVEQYAEYKTSFDNELLRDGTLCSLQKNTAGVGSGALRMFHANTSAQNIATLVLLENRVESCIALNSPSEYRFWLLSYVRYLVNEGVDVRLREVCDYLLGPTHVKSRNLAPSNASTSTVWKPYVLGIFKRSLLRDEILPIVGSNLNFQRLYTEYHDQLDVCDGSGNLLS